MKSEVFERIKKIPIETQYIVSFLSVGITLVENYWDNEIKKGRLTAEGKEYYARGAADFLTSIIARLLARCGYAMREDVGAFDDAVDELQRVIVATGLSTKEYTAEKEKGDLLNLNNLLSRTKIGKKPKDWIN